MILIREYEFGLVSYDFFIQNVADCGELSIADVGEECLEFYSRLAGGYHEKKYYIKPFKQYADWYSRGSLNN